MSQIVCYRKVVFIIAIFLGWPLEAKLLKPSKNIDEKEILIINGKRRLYYPIKDQNIHYAVQGPSRIEFISRYPVIRNKKKSQRETNFPPTERPFLNKYYPA